MTPSRVAVTGPGGRLGRALVAALRAGGREVVGWGRPDYDLDDPDAAHRLIDRDRPALVVHAAAWTDVDGCARDPDRAMRRNGTATGELAAACAVAGSGLVVVSTNEVFDGRRDDGLGYREDDPPNPINPYGASKLAGEDAARRAAPARLWVVRTAWLYGPPGDDFPAKIVAAADRLEPGEPLRVVADEVGSPTYTVDLATGIVALLAAAPATYHLVNAGTASRADWAERILDRMGRNRTLLRIRQSEYERASQPPRWGVLDTGRAHAAGVELRAWEQALAAYLAGAGR